MVYRKRITQMRPFVSMFNATCNYILHTGQVPKGSQAREMAAGRRLTWYEEVAVPKRNAAGKSLRRTADAHGRSHSSQAPASNGRHTTPPAISLSPPSPVW